MTKDPFNSMLRRGLLPLPTGRGEDGWKEYGVADALAIVIAQQLALQGASQLQAKVWVSEHYAELIQYLTARKADRTKEVLFGVAFLAAADAGADAPVVTQHIFGTIREIGGKLKALTGAGRNAPLLAGQLSVSVTYCMGLIWTRSKALPASDIDAELYLLADLLGIS